MTLGPSYGTSASRAQLRAAATDRDRAADLLARAYAEGRLTAQEHEDRLARTMGAQTFGELDAVVADLPGPVPPAPPRTNSLAITALCCGVAQVIAGLFASIPAVVLGHMARRQIRRTGEQGDGMALAGLILGYIGIVLQVALVAAVIVFFAAIWHRAASTGGFPVPRFSPQGP